MGKQEAAFGVIFDEARTSVLLIKRRDVPVWVLPGGGIEAEEAPEKAVVRELFEETGYVVVCVRKVAVYLPVNRMTERTHFFECCISSGAPQINAECQEIAFFPLDKLPKLFPEFYRNWVEDARALYPHVLCKEIEGVSYWVLLKLFLQHPVLIAKFLLTKI